MNAVSGRHPAMSVGPVPSDNPNQAGAADLFAGFDEGPELNCRVGHGRRHRMAGDTAVRVNTNCRLVLDLPRLGAPPPYPEKERRLLPTI